MSILTREQVRRLTPKEQQALGLLCLAEAKRRDQLLEKAKRYRWQIWIASLMPAGLVFVFFIWRGWEIPERDKLVLFVVLLVVLVVVQWQVKVIHRRLDALIELLEGDLRGGKAEPSAGGNAASPRASA